MPELPHAHSWRLAGHRRGGSDIAKAWPTIAAACARREGELSGTSATIEPAKSGHRPSQAASIPPTQSNFASSSPTCSPRRPATGPAQSPHRAARGLPLLRAYRRLRYAQLIPARPDQAHRLVRAVHYVALDGLATTSAEAFATPLGIVPVESRRPRVRLLPQSGNWTGPCAGTLPRSAVTLPTMCPGRLRTRPAGRRRRDARGHQPGPRCPLGGPRPASSSAPTQPLPGFPNRPPPRPRHRQSHRSHETRAIGEERACGRMPIRGLLQSARRHGLRARTVDLRNSGDTAGPRDRVVGYGAFVFEEVR